jgi:uncharacterized protein
MGSSQAFPWEDSVPPGVRLTRWLKRWNHGGVEPYSLGTMSAGDGDLVGEVEVSRHRLWVRDLPERFRNFRIVQLSDIHHGLFLPLEGVEHVVEVINGLEPDLVAITGDYVTYSRAYIEPVARALGRLDARYGVCAVLGNHDYRVDPDAVASALMRRGIDVLRNRSVMFGRGKSSLYVAGVDDWGYGADLGAALSEVPEGAPTALLAHNPRIIHQAAKAGVNLVLSGHTHGGQVNLPVVGNLYARTPEQMRFRAGWDRLEDTDIYVSRGIGTVVLPWRYRCPPEIAQIELTADRRARFEAAPVSANCPADHFEGVAAPFHLD